MIPRQQYDLVSVSKLGIENGTPLTCEDCGRTILNFAVIKGKQDGKSYTVGLTCVKKLLQIKQVSFDVETQMKYEREVSLFDRAARWRKKLEKFLQKSKSYGGLYGIGIESFKDGDGNDFIAIYKTCRGDFCGWIANFEARFKNFFEDLAA